MSSVEPLHPERGEGSARSVAALVDEMAAVLSPTLGEQALTEARELLALLNDMPRHWPILSADLTLAPLQCDAARRATARRAAGAPLQYAAGRAAFRHLTLDVDDRVLIPRPETEQLVEIVLGLTRGERGGVAVDVGTGSGAVALSLASEGRFARVIGTDVSLDALTVARSNAARFGGRFCAELEWRHGSFLGPVPETGLRAIVSNPPYISYDEAAALPSLVRDWEPAVALYSGDGGMAATARLVRDAAALLAPDGVLALEVDSRRAAMVAGLARTHGAYADVCVVPDLTGRERFVVARRLEE